MIKKIIYFLFFTTQIIYSQEEGYILLSDFEINQLYFGVSDSNSDSKFFTTKQIIANDQDPLADIGPNIAPQTEGRSANLWTNDTETTNIQLRASDQDGDALTFTLATPPTNGTVTITETQTIGIVSQFVASYTPNTASTGSQQVDAFTFKVNDGQEDSNVSTVSINIYKI